jgi:hypothetical protein
MRFGSEKHMSAPDKQEFRLVELLGPFADLARPYVLWIPVVVAVVGFALGLLWAPHIPKAGPPDWLGALFGTAAQVIVTLLVALALQARYGITSRLPALLIPLYVTVGVLAAVAGTSHSLPSAAYKWLFALTLAGGSGALASAAVLAVRTIRAEVTLAVAERRKDITESEL